MLDEIGRLEFDGGADPRIEVEFSGDLDSFAGMRAEARLSSGGFRRGSYRVEGLEGELTLDGAKDRAVLQTLQLRDEKGVVRIRAEWPLKTREIACEVESSIDAKALLGAIFPNPKLGEVVFYEAPKVKFEGVLNLDALAAYRAKLAEKVGSDEDASSGDGAAEGRADAAMRSLGDLPLSAIGEFRCDRFGSRGEVFDGLEFSFSVEGGRFYVRNLRLDHKTGVMFANLMCDPALGDETFRYQSEVKMDPRTFTPFLAGDEMKEFLSSWDFDENSTVYLAAFGSGPGLEASRWTSEGIVDLRNFRLNHVAFDRIEANYEARGAEQSYRNVRMVRPEGEVTAPALHHQVDRRLWRIEDLRWSLDLSEGLRAICPDVVDAVKAYRFSKPPRVVVNGVVDARKAPGASPRAGRKHEFELDFESDEPVEYEMLGKTLSLGRPRGALKFVGDTVHLTDFTADLFGGEVNAGYLFDVTDPERRFEATVSLKKVPFEDLSRLYSDYAGTEGRLSGSVHLAGALGSAGSLNGAGTATIEEGDVFTIPLFGPLSKLIRNVLPEGNKTGYSVAREAKATFRLENGVLKTEDLEALTNAFRFTGRGRVDCADKTVAFDAAVNTRFAPTRMLLTPVSKLLEYTCEGTLTEPKWRPSLTKGLKLPGNANLGGAAPAKDD